MKIHESQAKVILAKYGVPVPRGEVVFKKDEARAVAQRLGTSVVVVKAQIHAGGRGKAGGVKLARSADEAAGHAEKILGMTLVTPQTGEEGRVVRRLLIEEGLDIKRELYVSILVDRATGAPIFMASTAGGMEIEEVAAENPDGQRVLLVTNTGAARAIELRAGNMSATVPLKAASLTTLAWV